MAVEVAPADEGLVRGIGLWSLAASTVNMTIGAGIFVLPATVAAQMGAAGLLAYGVCGIGYGLVVLCLAECGSRVTRSGGPVAYVGTAFGPYAEFLIGMLFWLAWGLGSDAAVATALADLAGTVIPGVHAPLGRCAFLALVFGGLGILNIAGVRGGVRFAAALTILKIAPLLGLIALGLPAIQAEHLQHVTTTSISQLGATSLVLFFAFSGGETAVVPGGEIDRPDRTVPLGVISGLVMILIIYGGLQLVAQGILGSQLPLMKDAPLAALAERLAGTTGRSVLLACSAVAMFSLLAGDLLATPRAVFALARSGLLPRVFARVHPRFHTPWVAIGTYAGMGLALATSSAFEQLARASSAAILIIYGAVAAATIELRRRNVRGQATAFVIPGGLTVPVLALIVVVSVLANVQPPEAVGLAVLSGLITIVYFVRRPAAR
jgi:amino acid transporter